MVTGVLDDGVARPARRARHMNRARVTTLWRALRGARAAPSEHTRPPSTSRRRKVEILAGRYVSPGGFSSSAFA